MTASETIQIFDSKGRIRRSFSDSELVELSALPGFAELIDASIEAEAAEKNMSEATLNIGEKVRELSAAQTLLEIVIPRVSAHQAIRDHLRSIGR